MKTPLRIASVVVVSLLLTALFPAVCFAVPDDDSAASLVAANAAVPAEDSGDIGNSPASMTAASSPTVEKERKQAAERHYHDWSDPIIETYTYTTVVCNGCGMEFDSVEAWMTHSSSTYEAGDKSHGSYSAIQHFVEETVGYRCSICGATSESDPDGLNGGQSGSGSDSGGSGTTALSSMYRLYNPNSGEHFYTASASERENLKKAGWTYEGIGWTAPTTSKTPVYRLYSGTDHHYTTSKNERDGLIKAGWRDEGVGWYSDDAKGVPLYRQFNPNVNPRAKRNNSGSHNYTTSKAENDSLVKIGWKAEGVGWYGVK